MVPLFLFPSCGCCVPLKVLIWHANHGYTGSTYSDLVSVYTGLGVTVNTLTSLGSHTLSEYALIHWFIAASDPPWWSEITGNTWSGRLHLTAEHNGEPIVFPGLITSINYVNALSSLTGISVTGDAIDPTCSHDGTVETDDMTAGLSVLKYTYTSRVSGGTTLSKTGGGDAWIARNKPSGSNIEYIVSGDANHGVDGCSVANTDNAALFQNMWTVPV
jgi:hypothetical protein